MLRSFPKHRSDAPLEDATKFVQVLSESQAFTQGGDLPNLGTSL